MPLPSLAGAVRIQLADESEAPGIAPACECSTTVLIPGMKAIRGLRREGWTLPSGGSQSKEEGDKEELQRFPKLNCSRPEGGAGRQKGVNPGTAVHDQVQTAPAPERTSELLTSLPGGDP